MGMRVDMPLVCPFCDEMAYPKKQSKKICLPNKIYTLRECIMGHTFYSVEEVPDNQDDIAQEISEIRKDATAWRKEMIKYKKQHG